MSVPHPPAGDPESIKGVSWWVDGRYPTVMVVIIVLIALIYGRLLSAEFVRWDDENYVVNNPHVHQGLSIESLQWACFEYNCANWHPVTWISHMVDCELFGLHPGWHHMSNLLLHTIASLLLLLALRSLTGNFHLAAAIALIFAVHPLHVESVAWVAERKDVLSGVFCFSALWAYGEYVRRPFSFWRYALILVLTALGLASKPTLVTLPFVLMLLDYWPLRRWTISEDSKKVPWNLSRRAILEKIPLILLIGLSSYLTMQAQRSGHAIKDDDLFPFMTRMSNALWSYVMYLIDTFFPFHLAPYYSYYKTSTSETILALLLLSMISGAIFLCRRRQSMTVGFLWFLGMLVPMNGLVVQVGIQARADRYMYLPIVGLSIALFGSFPELLQRRIARLVMAVVLLIFTLLSFFQVETWKNSKSLWTTVLERDPNNLVALTNLAKMTEEQEESKRLDYYRRAYQASLNQNLIHNLQGVVVSNLVLELTTQGDRAGVQGNPELAVELLEQSTQLDPDKEATRVSLSAAYTEIAVKSLRNGDPARAAIPFRKAVSILPTSQTWFNLARFELSMGHKKIAIDCHAPH